ncbi:ArnT family glycosyltransferase [Hydrogenophaga bisanensis]|uniref:ArnT family glycosyltransferase n=1 Tax=Hydrogenophaga bisanensis TaxID=439611 RepID=A0ABW2RAY4_9BURK
MTTSTQSHTSPRELGVLVILIAVAVVLASGIGLRAPWPADEPRFAQIAREMVESGQWLFPMRGGEPYPDKPPVFVWLVAVFYLLTGHLKVAFLLPSALAGLGTLWLVHDIGRRLWGSDVARTALLVLVFTPQFLLQAKTAQIDALVCFWITLGCYGLLRHFMTGPAWGWYLTAFAAMALGIMTKGVGFLPVLMLIPLALWGAAAKGPGDGRLWGWRSWLGLVVLLGTLALWLGPMLWQVAASGSEDLRAYRDNILLQQTAKRYANPWGHIKPWHYFLTAAIPTIWFPLALLLLTQVGRLVRVLRDDARVRVLFVWVVLVIVFFSLSRGKREVYILPALPMLSLVAAVVWRRAQAEGGTRWSTGALRVALVLVGLATVALGATAWWRPELLGPRVDDYADELAALGLPVLTLGVAVLGVTVLTWRRQVLEQLSIAALACWLFVAWWVWPVMDPHRTPKAMMAQLEQRLDHSHEVGLLKFKEQFLLFSQRPLVHFSYLDPAEEQERNAWLWMRESPQRVLLLPDSLALTCFDIARAQVLGTEHRRDWVLLDASAMKPTCEAPERVRRYRWAPQRMDILE